MFTNVHECSRIFREARECSRELSNAGKMADESEDQWLYGDSTDGKDYAQSNIQSEVQNDLILAEAQENSQAQEDQKVEDAGETPVEVRARHNLSRSFIIDSPQNIEKFISWRNLHLFRFRRFSVLKYLVSCTVL